MSEKRNGERLGLTDLLGRELPVPEEVHDLFLEHKVSIACRDRAIESLWKAKRAIMYGKQAELSLRKAWLMVRELYPKEYEDGLQYSYDERKLRAKAHSYIESRARAEE